MSNVSFSKKLASGTNAALMIAGVVGVLVAVNWYGIKNYKRIDMTEAEVNSLSQTSIDAVSTMEGLELRLYKSKKLPKSLEGGGGVIENVPRLIQQLQDKLDEYKRASAGNLTVTVEEDDLESQAGALNLGALKIPADKSEDADPDALNKRYYIGLSLHYRTVEEVIPVISNPGTFEYQITKAMLRLRSKQAASSVMRDLLKNGEELNKAVEECVKTIERYDQSKEKTDEELEGGIVEQMQNKQSDRTTQIDEYLANLARIDEACGKVSTQLEAQRASMKTEAATGRQLSREHFESLLGKIGWFSGVYSAWVASLIDEKRDPRLLKRLLELMKHPEIPARTSALRVLGAWLKGSEQSPGLQGPPGQQATAALRAAQSDESATVRAVAVQVIASAAGEAAAGEITKALQDKDETVREVALDLAMRLRVKVDGAAVKPFLKDSGWQVRRLAVAYLINTQQATVPDLRPLLADPNREVKFIAAYGLTTLNDTASTEQIQQIAVALPPGQGKQVLEQALAKMGAVNLPNPTPDKVVPPAPKPDAPAPPTPPAPKADTPPAPAPKAAPPAPKATPPGGPTGSRAPQGSGGGLRQALGRAGLDRLGDIQMPDPLDGVKVLSNLKTEINTAYTTLKDSPGRKSIGFMCGHDELCPFEETESKIPDMLAQAFEKQPFVKKAVDDIRGLEGRLNQHNEAIRQFFLSKGYRIVKVSAGQSVPEEVDALVIYGPRKPFADLELYDIDQFIMSGKPTIFLTNSYEVLVNQWDDKPPYNLVSRIESTNTNLSPFFAHYGIHANNDLVMETEKALFERINTVNLQMSNIGELAMAAKYSYPLFPIFEKFSENDPMVAGLRRVTMPFASSFTHIEGAQPSLTFEPLISSSERAVSKTKDFVLDPRSLKDSVGAEQTSGTMHVAVHVSGDNASSYFAGRQRPERPEPEPDPPGPDGQPAPPKKKPIEPKRKDAGPANIVIIGSNLGFESLNPSRLLHDFNIGKVAQEKVTGLGAAIPYYIRYVNAWGRFIGQQNPIHLGERGRMTQLPGQQTDFWQKNLDLLFGVFDWATGDSGMAAIRAKADTDRPLKVTSENSRKLVSAGLVFGLPALLIVFAFLRFWLRRMGRKKLGPA